MKNTIIIYLGLALIITCSCNKTKLDPYTTILKGYVYNSIDSTPFKDTRFKFYLEYPDLNQSTIKEETFFYTDEKGYFEHSTSMSMGSIVWPSFHEGSAYIGPKKFGNAKRTEEDEENRIRIAYYDTLYTEPYQ